MVSTVSFTIIAPATSLPLLRVVTRCSRSGRVQVSLTFRSLQHRFRDRVECGFGLMRVG
jgi:hypothetical protein